VPPSSTTQKLESTPQDSVDESVLLARSSPAGLALATDPRFRYPPHVELIDETIVEAIAGNLPPRLIFEAPPRHGKSELVSRWTPAWYAGTFPDKRVMLGSYEAEFAATWGRKAREILETVGQPIFGVNVAEDARARNLWESRLSWTPEEEDLFDWQITDGGGMITAGVGGPMTGKGADLLIIDDPVKNREEADSPTYRKRTWEWWQSTAYTRLEPGGIAVVMQTRWHEDDLAGRLIAEMESGGEEWHVVRLPALAERNDPLRREIGEALWGERYDEEALEKIKVAVGTYVWEALYQQRPAPIEGGIFKDAWWRYYPALRWPKLIADVTQSWDMAFKKKSDTDYVVGQVWGRKGADRYLMAQVRGRMSYTETKKAVKALTSWVHELGVGSHRILVEDKANGPAIISDLRSEIGGLIPVEPEGSKEARAIAQTPQIESGNVFIPEGLIPAPRGYEPTRTEVFIGEHRSFPNATNDDQVDAASQALKRLSGGTTQRPGKAKRRRRPDRTAELTKEEW
jgi:predicted phage terminase large subunit-like protein